MSVMTDLDLGGCVIMLNKPVQKDTEILVHSEVIQFSNFSFMKVVQFVWLHFFFTELLISSIVETS